MQKVNLVTFELYVVWNKFIQGVWDKVNVTWNIYFCEEPLSIVPNDCIHSSLKDLKIISSSV